MSSAGDFHPGKLWSLLEMLELNAPRFVTLCQALVAVEMSLNAAAIGSSGQAAELPSQSKPLFGLGFLVGHSTDRLEEAEKGLEEAQKKLGEVRQAAIDMTGLALKQALDGLKEILEQLGLRFALVEVKRLEARLARADYAPVSADLQNISSRVRDELHGHLFLQINPTLASYYEPKAPLFGQDVATKFPSLIYEIQEAGNCYALERSTASAFHSIRCLEGGIRALSRCLQIPDPTKANERNWGKLLGTLKTAIDKKWPTSSDRLSGDGEFFENAYAALAAMQNPWRNATMHLDQKYTMEEAEHISGTVRGFMRKIASRCDEQGQPFA